MRALVLAAAAACGMAGSASAALVTYELTAAYDQFEWWIYVNGSDLITRPYDNGTWDMSRTIIIDTDVYSVENNTITVWGNAGGAPGAGGTWADDPYSAWGQTDLTMAFGADGEVLDWRWAIWGRDPNGVLSPTENYMRTGTYTPDDRWSDRFGPEPEGGFDFFVAFGYWTASTPGTWERVDATPVPLPASALLLMAGVGGLALIRRERRP